MRLPESGGARSSALWALSADPYPELPNSQEAPGIWRDPGYGKKRRPRVASGEAACFSGRKGGREGRSPRL